MGNACDRHLNADQLLRYHDRELPAVEMHTAAEHLESCTDCAEELARIHEALEAFETEREHRLLPSIPPPPPWPSLRAGFREIDERAEHRWFRPRLRPAAALLFAAAVGAAIYTWSRPESAPAPRPAQVGSVTAVPPAEPPATPARSVPAQPEAPARTDPAHVELEVLAALRSVDADLGEPLEIQPSTSGARVTGTGLPAARQRAISGALEGVGGVELHFEDIPAQAPAVTGRAGQVAPGALPFERELLAHFGRRTALAHFSDSVLGRCDAMMARAYALRNLEERFPAGRRKKLSTADLETFRQLREAHLRALEEDARETDRLIAPVATALGAPEVTPEVHRVGGGIEVLERVRRFDRVLNVLLAGTGSDLSQVELLVELSAARAGLAGIFR